MAECFRVEVTDHRNGEDECWSHEVPLDTNLKDLIGAVTILYPTLNGINISVAEEESS